MGMFDWVNFEMDCPACGKLMTDWQSKDGDCFLVRVDPTAVIEFYSICYGCETFVEFSRSPIAQGEKARAEPFTASEVEPLGFSMSVTPPSKPVQGHHMTKE